MRSNGRRCMPLPKADRSWTVIRLKSNAWGALSWLQTLSGANFNSRSIESNCRKCKINRRR